MLGVATNLDIVHKTLSLLRVAKCAVERTISASRSERNMTSGVPGENNHHTNKRQMLPYILLMPLHVPAYNRTIQFLCKSASSDCCVSSSGVIAGIQKFSVALMRGLHSMPDNSGQNSAANSGSVIGLTCMLS